MPLAPLSLQQVSPSGADCSRKKRVFRSSSFRSGCEERTGNYTVRSRCPRARFLLFHLSALGGEQYQIYHRRKRPHGGNEARRPVEIEKMPLLPQRERGGHVGIGGGEIDEGHRRHQRKAHERELRG